MKLAILFLLRCYGVRICFQSPHFSFSLFFVALLMKPMGTLSLEHRYGCTQPASTEHLAADGFHGQSSHFDHPDVAARLKAFAGRRSPVFYDTKLQRAKLLFFQATGAARLLQHHYSFTFFADRKMQSFYKRFIRDFMRYQDVIQCAGHELVKAIRADAAAHHQRTSGSALGNHSGKGTHAPYYALHVRRGDFQFKDVKISAEEIIKNLGGNAIIPRGAIVYVSTDDPKVRGWVGA